MSDLRQYKCPACGGAMEFDSTIQKMKCPYCDTVMDVQEYQNMQDAVYQNNAGSAGSDQWQAMGGGAWQSGETDGMCIYTCESCGGEIIADVSTGATTCPFCGNRIVMTGQFSGDLRPDYIIPFKLDKNAAKKAYHRHLSGKKFMPAIFKKENHIDEIKGLYVPFWLFDADTEANIMYEAERLRTWRSGDTEYTEHEIYNVQRAGRIGFSYLPEDCSRKMDDTLMESIEPYNFAEAVPFSTAYLAGYMADRYDVAMEERMERAKQRIKRSTIDAFKNTVQGYHSVKDVNSSVSLYNVRYLYALYPVWILNTTWKGKKYTFAMNGQTGKMVGDLPFDKNAFNRFVITWGVGFGAIVYAIMWLFMLL
ncbi:MAG: hypothetical protein MRZ59_11335 [Clostridiales bacterium]|nr:hypothetical protein [Clostridiales bacterium]MDY3747401.1 hypothetical protein [Lachnospiraceae bacterium]